jgi:exopolysaccharide biosynthesis polyprenyl glycosylphosphotransferase
MAISRKRESTVLFLGDIIFFYISLFLMLFISYLGMPGKYLLYKHLAAFSILFTVWVLVFFIAGLYEKHTILFKRKISGIVLNAQIVNAFIAILFFYFIPYFKITPKTNLFIYLIVSFALVLCWRFYIFPLIGVRRKEQAIIVGSGDEMKELIEEVNNNSRYGLSFTSIINPDENPSLNKEIFQKKNVALIVLDFGNEKVKSILPEIYGLLHSKLQFIDMYQMYEDIFDKTPLSLFRDDLFLSNNSFSPQLAYDIFKRFMDLTISTILGILSLVVYPFVFIAIKLNDGGPIFIKQERIGKNLRPITIVKFRTMEREDRGEEILSKSDNKITSVGSILRKSRIDELPQLWNIFKGDLSLIGPRPELPVLAERYNEEIPYYNLRHLIEPGLSGWAQIYHDSHPHHGTDTEETKVKLSYDLYYIANRSIPLDLKIALRTIMTLLSRSGV